MSIKIRKETKVEPEVLKDEINNDEAEPIAPASHPQPIESTVDAKLKNEATCKDDGEMSIEMFN